jgi:hypothetical protein
MINYYTIIKYQNNLPKKIKLFIEKILKVNKTKKIIIKIINK